MTSVVFALSAVRISDTVCQTSRSDTALSNPDSGMILVLLVVLCLPPVCRCVNLQWLHSS